MLIILFSKKQYIRMVKKHNVAMYVGTRQSKIQHAVLTTL